MIGISTFTSIRDLLAFASEIYLIHRSIEFTADATLIQQARQSNNVKIHTPFEVQEFLGTDKLSGLRIESIDKTGMYDLPVEGVFWKLV